MLFSVRTIVLSHQLEAVDRDLRLNVVDVPQERNPSGTRDGDLVGAHDVDFCQMSVLDSIPHALHSCKS